MNRSVGTLRLVAHVATRPAVLLPLLLAGAAAAVKWPLVAAAFGVVAMLRAWRLSSDPNLPVRLRLGLERRGRGVTRALTFAEAAAILAVERYADDLLAAGAAPRLATDTVDRAWRIVQQAGANDAVVHLRAFWASLPRVSAQPIGEAGDEELLARLGREVASINAAERELGRLNL